MRPTPNERLVNRPFQVIAGPFSGIDRSSPGSGLANRNHLRRGPNRRQSFASWNPFVFACLYSGVYSRCEPDAAKENQLERMPRSRWQTIRFALQSIPIV
jgi:hypothetical protein